MKKFFLLALLAVTVMSTAFSADLTNYFDKDGVNDVKKINFRVLHKFDSEFRDAVNVEWSLKPNFIRASFIMDDERMGAFYDLSGEFIGTSHAVGINQMPVNVKRVFAKKYSDYTVKETMKFEGVDESAYFISAENDTRSIILKVTPSGAVSLFKSSNKN